MIVSNMWGMTKTKLFFHRMRASKRSPSLKYVYSVSNREQILKRAEIGLIFMMHIHCLVIQCIHIIFYK